jgi:ABC-2 type transport system ATP-binding protein
LNRVHALLNRVHAFLNHPRVIYIDVKAKQHDSLCFIDRFRDLLNKCEMSFNFAVQSFAFHLWSMMAQIHSDNPVENPRPVSHEVVAWARGLTKKFGDQVAVEDLNFEVPKGSIFGFIGPSGCGKTTTIRLLTGILRPSDGEVQVLDRSPAKFSTSDRRRVGYLTQHFMLYPELTVWENMEFAASIYGVPYRRRKRLAQLLEFVDLDEHHNKLARNLSGGMKRRLALASTLIHKPELLFLDEPTAGIDPVLRRKIWDFFESLRAEGFTLFVTTQYVGEAAYCDLVGIMSQGRLLLVDTPEGMRRRAYGGDVVNMRTTGTLPPNARAEIEALPFVVQPVTQVSAQEVRVVVDEANTSIPPMIQWARNHGLEIESIGEYLPPFDDVFVKLVKQEEEQSDVA